MRRMTGTQIEDRNINTSRVRAFVTRRVDKLRRGVDTKMTWLGGRKKEVELRKPCGIAKTV